MARVVLLVVAVLLAPVGFRVALILEGVHGQFLVSDFRGLVSDAFVALLVASLTIWVNRWSRFIATLWVALWSLVQYVNFENVRALGSLVTIQDAEYLGNTTFLLGSALVISRPGLLALWVLGSAALAYVSLAELPRRSARLCLLGSAVLLGSYAIWPWADDVSVWRQTHFFQHNSARLARMLLDADPPRERFDDAPSAMLDLVPELRADLSGESLLSRDYAGSNVLLVILESVSGLRLPSLAEVHGNQSLAPMHELDALARRTLSYSSFINHQRKTARGLYALLCGELPNLSRGPTKMSRFAAGDRTCLPSALRNAGYATAYLQGAPLAFHMKDQFMPRAGFERVHGHDYFDSEYLRTYWGVDDRTLFEHSRGLIEDLEDTHQPWFLTLLTVGTHHPYTVPDDYDPEEGDEWTRALGYLDWVFGRYLEALERSGVLDDTILVVTSDESKGYAYGSDNLARISQNWGFLVIRLPGGEQARIEEPFAQMDLPLSLLDLLGLSSQGSHFFGRSVFRRYDEPRWIFFANGNKHDVGAIDPQGRMLLCLDDFRKCRRREPMDGNLFSREAQQLEWVPERDDVVAEMAMRSLYTPPLRAEGRHYLLTATPEVRVDQPHEKVLFGGQHLTVQPGEWVEVELRVRIAGTGTAEFRHTLRAGGGRREVLNESRTLRSGERWTVRYRYSPDRLRHEVQSRAYVSLLEGGGVDLIFEEASIVHHRDGGTPGAGVEILEESLESTPGDGDA
ncbi:LTA synthase family protein [Myxococcota bacterium]|nr:LTA synthase family protein [Myxococcota bacterium]